MKPILITLGVLLFFTLALFGAKSMARARNERWWQCAWCGCYFNEGRETSNVPPDKIEGHGTCDGCAKNTLKEHQMGKALK